MKKIGIVLVVLSALLVGCESFDYDMMVCKYHGMQSLSYEIRYKDENILNIAVVEQFNFKDVSEETYEKQMESIEQIREDREEYAGIKTSLKDDDREVLLYTEIDQEKYDCKKDKLSLLQLKLEKEDFKDVETLRYKLMGNRFECDEIVEVVKK